MESNASLRSKLTCLIETCTDGQEGFWAASENVSDVEIQQLFAEYSVQRAKFSEELQTHLRSLGDSDPEEGSSVSGAVHRGWINLKSAVFNKDPHAILVECERGESYAVDHYEQALKCEWPAQIREVISRQYAEILAAHNRVRAMSDASSAKWV